MLDWVGNTELKEALIHVAKGVVFLRNDACKAVDALTADGIPGIKEHVGGKFYTQYFPTDRHGGAWSIGAPTGVVDHYTAGVGASSPLRWFSNEPRPVGYGQSSAHYVMDYEGTLFTLVNPLTTIAWHATSANKDHVGIEHVNCGILKKDEDGKFLFMDKFLYRVNPGNPPELVNGQWWEPFTAAQFLSNIVLKRLLRMATGTLIRTQMIEHKDVVGAGKVDCGPLWPGKALNDLAFCQNDITGLESWNKTYMPMADVARLNAEVRVLLGT